MFINDPLLPNGISCVTATAGGPSGAHFDFHLTSLPADTPTSGHVAVTAFVKAEDRAFFYLRNAREPYQRTAGPCPPGA